MRRALAPFSRRDRDAAHQQQQQAHPGPYYHIEKPFAVSRNMTDETLVGVSAVRTNGNGWNWKAPDLEDNTRYLGPKPNPAAALTINTKNLAPLARAGGAVSPVSQVSRDIDLGSDVSPVSPSFNHAGTLPIQEPSPSPSPTPPSSRPPAPGRGTAISIAGSEARIVRIPPRSSRLPPQMLAPTSTGGEGAPPSGAHWRAARPGSQRTSSGSTELSPRPLAIKRSRPGPPVSMRAVPAPAAAAWAPGSGSNGGYQAYHPSLGSLHQGGGPSRVSYESRASLSGVSVASSDVFSPDSITWPMPPGTPTMTASPGRK